MHFKPTRHSEKKFKLSLSAIMRILPSSITLGVLSVLLICSPNLKAADLTYVVLETGVIITGYDNAGSGALVIPDTIEGKPVTSIGESAFFGSGITSITIPDSVTDFGRRPFDYCSSLVSIYFKGNAPRGLSLYFVEGAAVFIAPTSTGFGETVWTSNSDAELPVIVVDHFPLNNQEPGAGKLGPMSYVNNSAFVTITDCEENAHGALNIPAMIHRVPVKQIGNSAFEWCSNLTRINIPDGVTSIGGWAFADCYNLTSTTIPSSVTSISWSAFHNCFRLTNINFEDDSKLRYLGDGAFFKCTKLTSIDIPEGVTSIGYEAFYGCYDLTSITIPSSVTSIDSSAFRNCFSLTKITFLGNAPTVVSPWCNGCSGLPVTPQLRILITPRATGFWETRENLLREDWDNLEVVPDILVSPATHNIGAGGGNLTLNISSKALWNWSSDSDWLTSNENTTQEGNQVFSYTIAENTSIKSRSAIITFTAWDINHTHTLMQQGVPTPPIFNDQHFNVNSKSSMGTQFGTLGAIDPNEDLINYAILENTDRDGDGNPAFRIEGDRLLVNDSGDLIPLETQIKPLAAGGYHSLAVKEGGTVVAWGRNNYGQGSIPETLGDVSALSAGVWHSMALRENGTVMAWGNNNHGQINVPSGLQEVISVAAGAQHSLALKGQGTLVAWGRNNNGQARIPTGLDDVISIAAGGYHNLALKKSGNVVAWGNNSNGQSNVPSNLNEVIAISAGGFHSLALREDGTVIAWGQNTYGQRNVPVALQSVDHPDFVRIT